MWAWMLVPLLFWVLIIAAAVAGVAWLVRQGRPETRDPALRILRERYARGEISSDEFDARRRDLRAERAP
jgi:putative membrane protein